MKNKLLPFCSLVFSAGLLLFTTNAGAENIFTSSASKAGGAIVKASKATGSAAVKTAKVITPNSFFIEGSMLEVGGDPQIYGTQSGDYPYAIETVNSSASGAFRSGIGYDIALDKELRFSYFRLKTDNRNSTGVEGVAFYGNDDSADVDYGSASAEFEHEINSIDIEIAKTKVVSNDLDLKISGGLKYASYQRNVNAIYKGGSGFSNDGDPTSIKSDFKGFGPEIGIEADYKIASDFSVYGGANVALIAGNLRVSRNSTADTDSYGYTNKDRDVVPIFAGDFGLKWSKANIAGNNSLAIKIGYHIETWQSVFIDAAHYPNAAKIEHNDLALSGAYLRTTFSF